MLISWYLFIVFRLFGESLTTSSNRYNVNSLSPKTASSQHSTERLITPTIVRRPPNAMSTPPINNTTPYGTNGLSHHHHHQQRSLFAYSDDGTCLALL